MREILFRGKRLYDGKWSESVCPLGEMHSGHLCDDFDPNTVGQYTGLKDKNGKKIFEGDIWDCNGCIGVIKWVDEVCSFEANYVMHGIEYANAVSDYRAAKVEVIGNIHDNPGLLREKE